MIPRSLTIYEEILLLALDDDKGTADSAGFYTKALGGAILAELAMTGAVTIEDDKKKRVHAVRGARLDDPILAECSAMVRSNSRSWIAIRPSRRPEPSARTVALCSVPTRPMTGHSWESTGSS